MEEYRPLPKQSQVQTRSPGTGFARCTMLVTSTMDFTGTVTGGLLDASFAHDALIDCPNEGFVSLNVRLRRTR